MGDDLVVRIDVVGHASRRWRGAKTPAEAERLNQQLSGLRAQNVRRAVEAVVKKELPGISIEVPARGVGSSEGFPTAGEDNAAVDRSVLVTIDFTTVGKGETRAYQPHFVYAPSSLWQLRVLALIGGSAIGAKGRFVRIAIRNVLTGGELKMAGYVFGGSYNPSRKQAPVDLDVDRNKNPQDVLEPVGNTVTFRTEEDEDFGYWVGLENGQWVRLVHDKVGLIRKRELTFLQFTGLDSYYPGSLVFEYEKGWSKPALNISVETGKLAVEGDVPSDFVEMGDRTVTVPTAKVRRNHEGLLLSFPTGKSGLSDLTSRGRQRLTDFVTARCDVIHKVADGMTVINPRRRE